MKGLSKHITNLCALLTVTVGLLVLTGWLFDVSYFKNPVPGIISMKFNTAVCFVCCGALLYCVNLPVNPVRKRIIGTGAAVVLVFAVANVLEYAFRVNIGIDTFLWKEKPGGVATVYPGRMSLLTAINFITLSFLFLTIRDRKFHWIIQALAFFTVAGAGLTIANYIFQQSFLTSLPQLNTMALHTALLFLVICVGIIFSEPLREVRLSFRKTLIAFFSIVFLLLGILFYASIQSRNHANRSSQQIEHTLEVLLTAEELNSQATTLQSSVRGFIISGDSAFYHHFIVAHDSLKKKIARLRRLTLENTIQQTRIDSVSAQLENYIASRNEIISVRISKGADEARRLFSESTFLFDEIKSSIEQIRSAEQGLLNERQKVNERSEESSSGITLFFQVIVLFLLVSALIVIYNNLLARDRAEQALRKSEELVKAIIDNTSSLITIRDTEGNYLLVNPPVAKLLGREVNDIVGKSSYEFLPPATAAQAKTADDSVIKARSVLHSEITMERPDGIHYFAVNRFPFFDEDKNVVAIGTLSTDITLIKRAEEQARQWNTELEKKVAEKTREVQEKEQQYRFLIENMREGIQVIGKDWRYKLVNKAVVEQSRTTKEILLSQTIMQTYPGVEETPLFKALERCMEERVPETIESEFVFPDGKREWFELSIQPVPEGIFILSADITPRKTAEQAMQKFSEELKRSNVELERFAYVASHDLQEPLRMVSSFLNLLEEEYKPALDETAKKYIRFAVDGAARMKLLVNDLLQYSRIGTNKEEFTQVDLNETISYVLRVFDADIKKSGAMIKAMRMPLVEANKTLMARLFTNLVGNALKYQPEGNTAFVEIGFRDEGNKHVFYVKDNGIGIDPKFFEKIFIIFQRLHGKTEYSGTGIGLAMCKKIVELHRGQIWVDSDGKEGSTFYFSLPKTHQHV